MQGGSQHIVQIETEEENSISLLFSHLLQPPAQDSEGVWFERWMRQPLL